MINPNNYPSATGVRFVAISASATMMVLWFGYQIPSRLAFLNRYFDKPMSLELSLALITLFWLVVLVVYVLYQMSVAGQLPQSEGERKLAADAQAIAAEMGLPHVDFAFGQDLRSSNMAAYGFPWRRKVFIQRGAVIYRARHPDRFKARLCHELGHIKNGDIDTGVLSLAVLYVAYAFIMGIIGFWSSQYLMSLHRLITDRVALSTLVQYGAPFFGAAVAWLLLLWMENRAFVREREFMADAEAAFRVGPALVENALTAESSEERRTLADRIVSLTRVHPSTHARRASIRSWERAGLPNTGTVFITGAVLALFASTSDNVAQQYSEHEKFLDLDLQTLGGAQLAEILSNGVYAFTVAYAGIFTTLIISALVALTIRIGMQHRMTGTDGLGLCSVLLRLAAALGLGIYLGGILDPVSMQDVLETGQVDLSEPERLLWAAVTIFILSATAAYASARWLMTGQRTSPVTRLEWFLLAFFFYAVNAQIFVSFYTLLTVTNQEIMEWRVYTSLIGTLVFYVIALGLVIRRIRTGSFRFWRLPVASDTR